MSDREPDFEHFPDRLIERFERDVDWPRPRRDPEREPSHPWARIETRVESDDERDADRR